MVYVETCSIHLETGIAASVTRSTRVVFRLDFEAMRETQKLGPGAADVVLLLKSTELGGLSYLDEGSGCGAIQSSLGTWPPIWIASHTTAEATNPPQDRPPPPSDTLT